MPHSFSPLKAPSALASPRLLSLAPDNSQREPLTAKSWCIAPPRTTLPPGLLPEYNQSPLNTRKTLHGDLLPSLLWDLASSSCPGHSSTVTLPHAPPTSPAWLPAPPGHSPFWCLPSHSLTSQSFLKCPLLSEATLGHRAAPSPSPGLLPGSANLATHAFTCSNAPSHVLGHYPYPSLLARVPAL